MKLRGSLTERKIGKKSADTLLLGGLDSSANAITLPKMCEKIFTYVCLKEKHSLKKR